MKYFVTSDIHYFLEDYYKDYRDGNPAVHERAKKFLDAYNAWIMLQDFDIIVKDLFGSIINVTPSFSTIFGKS